MRGLILVAVGAAALAAGGFVALRRARVERARSGWVTVPTVIAAFVAYLGPSVCSLLASWWSAWLLPLPRGLAYPLGGALLVVGLVGYNAARREFHSARRNWGMRTDRLITTGPYAYSRNPPVADVGAGAARCGGRGPFRRRAGADRDLLGGVRVRDPGGRAGRWNGCSARSTAGIARPCPDTCGCHAFR